MLSGGALLAPGSLLFLALNNTLILTLNIFVHEAVLYALVRWTMELLRVSRRLNESWRLEVQIVVVEANAGRLIHVL